MTEDARIGELQAALLVARETIERLESDIETLHSGRGPDGAVPRADSSIAERSPAPGRGDFGRLFDSAPEMILILGTNDSYSGAT